MAPACPCVVRDPGIAVSLQALPPQPKPKPAAKKAVQAKVAEPRPSDGDEGPPRSREPSAPDGPEGASGKSRRRVNTSSKGTAIELAAIKVLEAEGYKVHRCVRTGVKRGPFWFSQSNDVFGCIDLVAKKRGERTRWVQVTADSGVGRKRKEMEEIPWDPAHDSVEIWRWVGGQQRRHKTTGAVLERQYFQVYRLDRAFALDKADRVLLAPPAPTPGGTAT